MKPLSKIVTFAQNIVIMDYNTQREKLLMPEYGRHVQKMIDFVKNIQDKDKRNEQVKAVIQIMGILNPQLRDLNDFKHKLWDHVQIISDFEIDIDSPYPVPTKETFLTHPDPITLETKPILERHYGRNIQNMIEVIASREDDEVKTAMINTLAYYMQQQYQIWKKDHATEEIIFKDIVRLSGGRIVIPEGAHIEQHVHVQHNSNSKAVSADSHNSHNSHGNKQYSKQGNNQNKKNKKRRPRIQ